VGVSLYTSQGKLLALQQEIGGGGEGVVYASPASPSECAKVYFKPPSPEHVRKLYLMAQNPPEDPACESNQHRSIAWPSTLLYADLHHTQCVGFLMPKLDRSHFREVIHFFDPDDRNRQFGGGFNWKYLFTTGLNIASSVAAIHQKGYCIGDFNESNILVERHALIALIDCDSFQVRDLQSGHVYRCPVGKPEYTAPEIQGKTFSEVDRTPETDCFALAVLLFQLMMEGTHPYQAKGKLVEKAESTQAKLIEGHFPYPARSRELEPPDHAPPFEVLPPELQQLFLRCFKAGHLNRSARPSAREWFEAMLGFKERFKECLANKNHVYLNQSGSCPWCRFSKEKGKDPFPPPLGQQLALDSIALASETEERRFEALKAHLQVAFADGVLAPEEMEQLKTFADKLQIRPNKAKKFILDEAKRANVQILSAPSPATGRASSTQVRASIPASGRVISTPAAAPPYLSTPSQSPAPQRKSKVLKVSILIALAWLGFTWLVHLVTPPTFQLRNVVTCTMAAPTCSQSNVFHPNELLFVYAQMFYEKHENVSVEMTFQIMAQDGKPLSTEKSLLPLRGNQTNLIYRYKGKIPPDILPGVYTAHVEMRNLQTGQVATAGKDFVVRMVDR
jgi:serine/threonine protein kinase